jgi:hypothetical protein
VSRAAQRFDTLDAIANAVLADIDAYSNKATDNRTLVLARRRTNAPAKHGSKWPSAIMEWLPRKPFREHRSQGNLDAGGVPFFMLTN